MAGECKYNRIAKLSSCFNYDDKQIHSVLWNTFLGLNIVQST